MLPVCYPSTLKAPAAKALASFFANVTDGWTPAADQSTIAEIKTNDLQIAIGTGSSTRSFTMTHKMGLVTIPMVTQSNIIKDRYYLSGETTYNWTDGTASVTSSSSYSGNKPYKPGTTHYYIAKPSSTSFTTTSTQTGYSSTLTSINNSWSSGSVAVTESYISNVSITMSSFAYITNNAYTIAIGDVLYSDGALSRNTSSAIYSQTSSRAPVGIVFTTSTSATDNTKWKHGYVMALNDAATASSTGTLWAKSDVTPVTGTYKTTLETVIAMKDGYTETQAIKSSNYPAAYAAVNYMSGNTYNPTVGTGTKQTSGWYLPSSGQWYDIINNLGGVSYTSFDGKTVAYPYWNIKTEAEVTDLVNSINNRLKILKDKGFSVTNIEIDNNLYHHAGNYGYWTSTRCNQNQGYRAKFGIRQSSDDVYGSYGAGFVAIPYNNNISGNFPNLTEPYSYVRTVLAF